MEQDVSEHTSEQYIKDVYKLPFIKKGMKVNMDGKDGVITGFSRSGAHILVKFKDGSSGPVHPTWKMTYFNDDGTIAKQFTD